MGLLASLRFLDSSLMLGLEKFYSAALFNGMGP